MRRILMASVAVALAAPFVANAADLSRQAPVMPTKAPPFMAPQFTWEGFYVGVNGGGGWGHARSDLTGGFGTSGGLVGGTAGYNAQFGNLVLGVEADIDWTNVGGSTANGCPGNCTVQGNWLSTERGRVGYAFGNFLPYVTGGLAVGDVKATVPGFAGQDQTQVGWAAGLGAEYALTKQWSVKAEYLRVDLGRFDCGVNCGGTPVDNVSSRENVVRGGINLHF
jgi:outer membrane immunogenic protein